MSQISSSIAETERIAQADAAVDAPADAKNVRRAALAGLIGTMLENYDFVIYGTASALIFSKLFFPTISPAVGVIAAFGAYAIGFLARPLGGLFFSHYGEKFGRKWVLVTTLFLMGGATFAIGCLPTYETAGVWAPLLLVLCRFFQGFGAGATFTQVDATHWQINYNNDTQHEIITFSNAPAINAQDFTFI